MIAPFLKYPGGKARLAERVLDTLEVGPDTVLVEPFLGAGAVTLGALERGATVYASDASDALMMVWHGVALDGRRVMERAERHLRNVVGDASYRALRTMYNTRGYGGCVELTAAQAIALNRACFNGLWRFNAAGAFNVPWGKNPRATVPQAAYETAEFVQDALRRGRLHLVYRKVAEVAGMRDAVVYLDPPYAPSGSAKPFTSYGAPGWTYNDTVRLVGRAMTWVRVYGTRRVVLSYMDDDALAGALRNAGWTVDYVTLTRSISRSTQGRGPTREIFATLCA